MKIFPLVIASFFALALGCAPAAVRMDPAGRQIVTVQAWQWGYEPAEVSVRAGHPVVLRAESLDVAHSLVSEELGLDLRIPARGGGVGEAVFTPDKPGEYTLRCLADCGPARARMTMTLIILKR